jgi:glucokinase-like ROK family protein
LIWKEQQISRADIARRIGLSRSTVTENVKELLKTDLVSEVGVGQSSGGRRPIVLEFQNEARGILGIDIGATHVSVALTDLQGRLLVWKEEKHSVRTDPGGTRELIFKLCDDCLDTWEHQSHRLLSIGIAVPSPIDPSHPGWLPEAIIPSWHGRVELKHLSKRYGVPVYIDNDANLGALAEYFWGAGRGVKNLVYIKLGYGIGAGFVLGGQIYRGSAGIAGELGHIPIDLNGKHCICGLRGCLVTFVGAEALEDRVHSLFKTYPESVLVKKELTINAIETAALKGDELAIKVVKEAAELLGIAITGWLNMMNPNMIILGGSLSRVSKLLLEPIRKKIKECSLVDFVVDPKIKTSKLGQKATAIGAATLALEEAFSGHQMLIYGPRPGVL